MAALGPLVSAACSDGTTMPATGVARFEGPSVVTLMCGGPAVGLFDAGASTTSAPFITKFRWYRDGEHVGGGNDEEIEFLI